MRSNLKKYIKDGRILDWEWNKKIMPKIESGEVVEREDLIPKGFLMIYQAFDSVLEDADGTLYKCTGWNPPGQASYVDIAEWDKPSKNKKVDYINEDHF